MAPGEGFEPPRADAQTLTCIIERKIGTLFSVYIDTHPFGSTSSYMLFMVPTRMRCHDMK